MTDQNVQALVVFFQLSMLNQETAEEAAQSAYVQIAAQAKTRSNEHFDILFVRNTERILRMYRKPVNWKKTSTAKALAKQNSKQSSLVNEAHTLDLSPWRDYFKSANTDEIATMIWSHILKIPENHIAEALGLSAGTIRHRLSRGLRSLSTRLERPQVFSPGRRPWN